MPTPLSEVLPQIATLNVPDQPFSYHAQGKPDHRLVGHRQGDQPLPDTGDPR